jgi:hypothetical protein
MFESRAELTVKKRKLRPHVSLYTCAVLLWSVRGKWLLYLAGCGGSVAKLGPIDAQPAFAVTQLLLSLATLSRHL